MELIGTLGDAAEQLTQTVLVEKVTVEEKWPTVSETLAAQIHQADALPAGSHDG